MIIKEEILLHGVQNINRLNLSMHDLSGLNLSGINLNNADLSKADLSGTNLSKSDLRGANLREANLCDVDFGEADLHKASLSQADLRRAKLSGLDLSGLDLSGADLRQVDFSRVNLHGTDLSGADLSDADLCGANLSKADLSGSILCKANLRGADLRRANLSQANLNDADLTGCQTYGISAWDVQLENTIQVELVITKPEHSVITVDNLEVAQFINLLLNNKKIGNVIDSITSKVVLILGRFSGERKKVLDAIREELRTTYNYTPVLFDFEKPRNLDLTQTVSTLAHLARFIIADLTDPSCIPYELKTIVPHCIVPVRPLLCRQPLITEGKEVKREAFAMFRDLRRRYNWVLPIYYYQDTAEVLASLKEKIIDPAEKKAGELTNPKERSSKKVRKLTKR